MTPLNKLYSYYEEMLTASGMNANSCEWIEIDGALDIKALRQAALLVQHRHPVLRSRVRRGHSWTFDPDVPPPEIIEAACPELDDAALTDRLMLNIWARPLPLDDGPPFRLHVTTLPSRNILQIVTSHVFTDGRSANVMVADLIAAYRSILAGCPCDWLPIEVTQRDLHALYLARLEPARRRSLYLTAARSMAGNLARPCLKIASRGAKRGMTGVVMRDLGPDLLAGLRRASSQFQVSRHPFYMLASLRVITAFNARRGRNSRAELRIIDNVSLRRFAASPIEDLYDLCAIPYTLALKPDQPDMALLHEARDRIAHLHAEGALEEVAQQLMLARSAALLPKVLGLNLVLKTLVKSNFILSNIGNVDDRMWEGEGLNIREYYSFSQLFPPGQVMFFMSTSRGRLRLVCLYDSANFSRAEVENELCDGYVDALQALCPAAPVS